MLKIFAVLDHVTTPITLVRHRIAPRSSGKSLINAVLGLSPSPKYIQNISVDGVEKSEYSLANGFDDCFVNLVSGMPNGKACSYIKNTNLSSLFLESIDKEKVMSCLQWD